MRILDSRGRLACPYCLCTGMWWVWQVAAAYDEYNISGVFFVFCALYPVCMVKVTSKNKKVWIWANKLEKLPICWLMVAQPTFWHVIAGNSQVYYDCCIPLSWGWAIFDVLVHCHWDTKVYLHFFWGKSKYLFSPLYLQMFTMWTYQHNVMSYCESLEVTATAVRTNWTLRWLCIQFKYATFWTRVVYLRASTG